MADEPEMDLEAQGKGLVGALMDFSFSEFVTPKMFKLIYGLLLAVAVLVGVFGVLMGLYSMVSVSFFGGLMSLVMAIVGMGLGVIFARVWVEVVMVLFRVAENTGELVKQGKRKAAAPAAAKPAAPAGTRPATPRPPAAG